MKKTLAIILALVSILTFTMATTQAEEEKRVLTIGSTVQMGDFWEYDSFKKVQEELNMEIDCTYYSEDSMAPMLAGGALPDIVITSSNLIKPDKVVSNKLALDIAPYLEQYAPNMLSPSYATAMKFSKETMSDDGDSVYIICPCVGTHNVNGGTRMMGRGYVVNWEYYKELGCPEIKNDDDYLDVLLRMRENHPTTEDGSPMFLMGVEKNFTDMGGYRACFLKDVSLNAWTPYFYKNNIFTNELVNCYTDFEKSSYWHDMEFYNKV